MALTEHGKKEDGRYELTVTIPAKEFCEAVDKVYHRENRRITIPGFRKGKAPRAVVERIYGDNFFYEDALNDLLPDEFDKAVEQADIKVIGHPEVDVEKVGREDGAAVKFTCKLRPELELREYKGLSADKNVYTVEQADIDRELELLRDKQSRVVSVEGRAARDGDIAVIDFEGFVDGKAFQGGKGEGHELTLGSGQFIPGFEEQIVGRSAGDEFDVNVTFPAEYGADELAGKAAVFKVKLHEIKKKESPALDDEFAKDASEFDTLEELKDSIKKRLSEMNEQRSKSEVENTLLEKMVEGLEGEVPHEMIEEEIGHMLSDFEQRLRSQHMDMQTYFKYTRSNLDALKQQMRDQAVKTVRTRLALEAVMRKEKFEITRDEIEAEFKKYADDYSMEVDKIKQAISEKELVDNMKAERALDLIRSTAKLKDKLVDKLGKALDGSDDAPAEKEPEKDKAEAKPAQDGPAE